MVGYILGNTLSANGSVSRGVADMDANNYMNNVVERTKIQRVEGTIQFEENEVAVALPDDSLVSMNFWGFHPNIFPVIKSQFLQFVKDNPDNPKAEFYIPLVANSMVQEGSVRLKVLTSHDKWHGVTYQEDKPDVMKALQELTDKGNYPSPLWQ